MRIKDLLTPPVDVEAVAAFLDRLHHEGRVAVVNEIGRQGQEAIWNAAEGFRKISAEDVVPPDLGPLVPVIHWGHNSLPAFTRFQKRFTRPDDRGAAEAGELWGYNHQALGLFTGPGYFVAYDADGEVCIDYTRVPPHGAPGWPKVLPNSARLARFVYNGTKDYLRGVSAHVTIGRATRAGEPMPNWFLLCREPA